jgi:hypothetical protein
MMASPEESLDDIHANTLARLEQLEGEAPEKADQFLQALVDGSMTQHYGRWLKERWQERRELLTQGTWHGLPVFRGRQPGKPVHPQITSLGDGTCEGHVVRPRYWMEHYRQYCKYCHATDADWWMMDQRDYCIKGITIILCGRCEHTSAQDHETRTHRFQPADEALMAATFEYFRQHGHSPSGLVEAIPRHRERR